MKNKNLRLMGLALALTVALSALPVQAAETEEAGPVPAGPVTFSDVPENHWAASSIAAVTEMGIMQGVGGGQFAPERTISVAEFLTMLVRQICPERVDPAVEGAWYVPYLYAGNDLLITSSFVSALENPAMLESELNRYDMANMVAQVLDGATYADVSAIADWGSVPDEYKDGVAIGRGMGLLLGVDAQGTFNGQGTMTRAQAAAVMERLTAVVNAQRSFTPMPAGALAITSANAQAEAMDSPDGFYIYSLPDGEGDGNNLGRITFDNPGYTHLCVTMRTGSTPYEWRHVLRVFDVSGAQRELLFYISQRSDTQRTYEVDVTGVRSINLAICHTCYCEATLTQLCLY